MHLLLLSAERAWSHAMEMKHARAADGNRLVFGSARRHICSRIRRSSDYASRLVSLLNVNESGAAFESVLQAHAYHKTIVGLFAFEKQQWLNCVSHYSEARFVYDHLASSDALAMGYLFKEVVTSDIDPSLRYAAHQLGISRATSIENIIVEHLPYVEDENETDVVAIIRRKARDTGSQTSYASKEAPTHTKEAPKSITWRQRTVSIEHAGVANALADVSAAEAELVQYFSTLQSTNALENAAAYDRVLIASQDAVDASGTAIDELTTDGVPQGDRRMQALQITHTALHFKLVGWRIGRNRILCGDKDGLLADIPQQDFKDRLKNPLETSQQVPNGSRKRKILSLLKERTVLYDGILQSLDSVKSLPGVASDETFGEELRIMSGYFQALRCLAIARCLSHLDRPSEALALVFQAHMYAAKCTRSASGSPEESHRGKPPGPGVTEVQILQLNQLLQETLTAHRGGVALKYLRAPCSSPSDSGSQELVRQLDVFPAQGVDLKKLVEIPPKISPVAVKPIFLDLAYNHLHYPNHIECTPQTASTVADQSRQGRKEIKRGWFGFGR